MIYFCIFIIILAMASIIFIYYQCNIKITEYKRQILTLTNQLSKYKDTAYKNNKNQKKTLIINFNTPEFKYGIVLPNTAIFLSPSEESIVIAKTKGKHQVKILDEAEINKEIFYYSLLNTESKINCNGWIKKSQFSMLMEDNNI